MTGFIGVGPVARGDGNSQSFTVTPTLPAATNPIWVLCLARNYTYPTGDPTGSATVSADWSVLGGSSGNAIGVRNSQLTNVSQWWSAETNPDTAILIEHANAYRGGPWAAFVVALAKPLGLTVPTVAGTQTRGGASGPTPTDAWTYTTSDEHTNLVVSATAPFGGDSVDNLNGHTLHLSDLQASPVSPGGSLDVFVMSQLGAAATYDGPTLNSQGRFVQRVVTGFPIEPPDQQTGGWVRGHAWGNSGGWH